MLQTSFEQKHTCEVPLSVPWMSGFQKFQTKFQDIVRFGLRYPGILNHNFRFQGKEWILQLRGKTFAEQEATIPASCISGCIAWSTEANGL